MSNLSLEWIQHELSKADFNDQRLNKRFLKLASELAERPANSIHHASLDWASTKAAYRFFDNANVTPEKILSPHVAATAVRSSGYNKVIIAEDTCYIDFSKHSKTDGLGTSFVSHGKNIKGICSHSGLVMTDAGLPLGLCYQKLWIRKEIHQSEHKRSQLPIQLKESFRWIECMRKARSSMPDVEMIMLADREGDIYELLREAIKLNVGLVVRSQHDRQLCDDELDLNLKLSEVITLTKSCGKLPLEIPSCGSRKAAKINLDIRFTKIVIDPHPNGVKTPRTKNREELELYVVDATELGGELSWRLLTTIPVNNLDDAKEVLRLYKMRWKIELYFKTLKTGCTIEDCRLGDASKLMNYISLMSIIAWRLFWMNLIAREDQNVSCEVALTKAEWKVAWMLLNRKKIKEGLISKKPPDKAPTLREAIRWIAGTGGFLGRKSDGEPGIITFWRGWKEVLVGLEIYEIYN